MAGPAPQGATSVESKRRTMSDSLFLQVQRLIAIHGQMVLVRRIQKPDGIALSSPAQPAHRRRGGVVASADYFGSAPEFRLLDRSANVARPGNPA